MNEVDKFPIVWAFSTEQFEKGLREHGITSEEELVRLPINGGFIRKTDVKDFFDMLKRHDKAKQKAFEDDAFLIDAMCYELANHEYDYTGDEIDALEALGIDEASMDDRARKCLDIAKHNLCDP